VIYLDNAATTMPKPECVYAAVEDAMRNCASLGRSGHTAAQNAAEAAFRCRTLAGKFFELPSENIVFTLNTTHGINMAINSIVKPGDRVVISGFEHNAVLRTLYRIGAEIVVAGKQLFCPDETIDAFRKEITESTKAVVCTHVSNAFGYILPVDEIAKICRQKNVPLIVDAAQSAGVCPVSVREWQAAFVAVPGHKSLFGPQGTGMLLCGQIPEPLVYGGTGSMSMEMDMPAFLPDRGEAGTQNIPGIAGLHAGMAFLREYGISNALSHERSLLTKLIEAMDDIPQIKLFSGPIECQTGVLSFTQDAMDCEELAGRLSDAGIAVRAGLHCAPLAHASAGTLEKGTVRISVSVLNTEEEIDETVSCIKKLMQS